MAKVVLESAPIVKPKASHDDWIMRLYMTIIGLYLLVSLALPLYVMLVKSFCNYDGEFIGLANYLEYFSTPALFVSIYNSLCVSVITTLITICLAFIYAYALQRSRMPWKGYFRVNAMTTVSAVVFLYSPETTLAAVEVLNMDDAGNIAPAAAMGMMIFYTNAGARLLHAGVTHLLSHRLQAWRSMTDQRRHHVYLSKRL